MSELHKIIASLQPDESITFSGDVTFGSNDLYVVVQKAGKSAEFLQLEYERRNADISTPVLNLLNHLRGV